MPGQRVNKDLLAVDIRSSCAALCVNVHAETVAAAQVGSDDDGYAVRMRLRHYLRYAADPVHGAADDSPLYIFDGTFAERRGSRGMRRDYEVRHASLPLCPSAA